MRWINLIAAIIVFCGLGTLAVLYSHIIPQWDASHFVLGAQQFNELEEKGGRQYYLVRTQAELAAALARSDESKIIFADGETGPGVQFDFGPAMPATMALGAANDLDLTRRFAQWAGQGFRILGIDVVLTPQADLFISDSPSILGWRSFGSDPDLVTNHAQAYIKGLGDGGVFPIVKHYPGHGMTPFDTHDMVGNTSASYAQVETHLKPFRVLSRSGLNFGIMVGHLAADSEQFPGAASSYWMNKLRQDLAFEGLVISDSANMAPVKQLLGGELKFSVAALQNETDLILEPISPMADYNAVRAAKQSGTLSKKALQQSSERLDRLYQQITALRRIAPPDRSDWIACGEELGHEILQKGCVELRSSNKSNVTSRTLVRVGEAELSTEAINRLESSLRLNQLSDVPIFDPAILPTTSPLLILYWPGGTGLKMDKPWTSQQLEWLRKSRDGNTPVSVVVFGNPMAGFQLREFPSVTGLITWGRSTLSCKAAADWLTGNFHPEGTWPIE